MRRLVAFLRAHGLVLLACVGAVLFRLPALIHARELDADSAVVSLQAQHMLRGELSLLLWGSPYQASFEAAQCALFYGIFGVHPWVFVSVALLNHLIVLLTIHALVRRRATKWASFVLILPLVASPLAVTFWSYRPIRELSFAMSMTAIWLLDGQGSRTRTRYLTGFAGGLLAMVACFQDSFSKVFLPGALAMTFLTALYEKRITVPRWSWAASALAGFAIGYELDTKLLKLGGTVRTAEGLSFDFLSRNVDVLAHGAIPWSFGYEPASELYRVHGPEVVWKSPPWLLPILHAGAWTIAAVILVAVAHGLVERRDDGGVRKIVLVGLALVAATLGGALVSSMVFNATSFRYLTPVIFGLPLVGLALAKRIRAVPYLLLTTPMLITFAVSGWVHYTSWVEGFRIREHIDGFNDDERAIGLAMQARGIRYGASGYWTAFQMTNMFQEKVIVAPTYSFRYPPYNTAFNAAKKVAYIQDADGPLGPPADGIMSVERQRFGIYEVTFVERK